ncbi:MAG: hypothetical protein AB8B61_06025 [Cyclobacteriaceae bacterium]
MKKYRIPIILFVLLLFIIGLITKGAIPQDITYHSFTDNRTLFGIPNFWDVVSNFPMFAIGLYSLIQTFKKTNAPKTILTICLPFVLSIGIMTTGIGSAYYHWSPNNTSLVWDRLPMTLVFMPFFSLLIYDFISPKVGRTTFFLLVPLGIISVLYWYYTESIGKGDLRLYAFVQFFPILITPFIIWLFYKKKPYITHILYTFGWYLVAKLCEHFDEAIFGSLHSFWSGHTIKHLLSAVSLVYIVKIVTLWKEEAHTRLN